MRGITVAGKIEHRGRRLGSDVFAATSPTIPLDFVGMGSLEPGGSGEISHAQLPAFLANDRFFFSPTRYTIMGLAVIEDRMSGLPIVAPATTEMATPIRNDVSGHADTDPHELERCMRKKC